MSDKLRNFIVRTLSGAVLLAVVFAAAWFGMKSYRALLLIIGIVGLGEFYVLAKRRGAEPQYGMGLITAAVLMNVGYYLYECIFDVCCCSNMHLILLDLLILFILFLFGIFVREVFRNKPTPIFNIAATIMGVVYVALPMAIMIFIPALIKGDALWSPWYFLWYLFLVWGNDVFAYLAGVCFGKHKMCPRLSPKKSWEGFVGGVVGSLAMGTLAAYILDGNYVLWVGLALVVSLSSVVGDLAESMFKREADVKDSGNIMPGHGGMLDRFDALLISAPFALIYLLIFRQVGEML